MRNTRRRFVRLLPWLIGLALLVWVIATVSWADTWAILRQLSLGGIGVLVVVNTLVLLAIAVRWWLLLAASGFRLSFGQLLGYRLAVFGVSYFTPGPHLGGEPLQVLFVERNHGVPRPAALAAVALDKALELIVNFTFLLTGVLASLRWRLLPEQAGQQAAVAVALMLGLPVMYLAICGLGRQPFGWLFSALAAAPLLRRSERWRHWLNGTAAAARAGEAEIARLFRRRPLALAVAAIVSISAWLLLIAEYWLMVAFLGVRLTLPQLVVALVAARVAILLLLPAGLGALEAGQALAFSAVGLDPAVGVAVSLLIRLRDTALGLFGLWWGNRALSRQRDGVAGGP